MNDARNSLRRLLGRRLRPISSIVLLALLVLILLLNLGLPMLEDQLAFSADLSAGKIYTLSEDSLGVLAELEHDIYLYPVYSPGNSDVILLQLLRKYAAKSSKVHLRELSADAVAREFSLSRDAAGVVVASEDGSMFRFIRDGYQLKPRRAQGGGQDHIRHPEHRPRGVFADLRAHRAQ